MKALVLSAPFGKGEYSVISKPIPTPAADQILVKIEASSLNPADWKIPTPAYGLFTDAYPITLGWDSAGVVVELGRDVQGFAKSDHVIAQGWYDEAGKVFHGTFQQYIVVPTHVVVKIPNNLSWESAATLFSSVSTIANSLFSRSPSVVTARLTPPWEAGGPGKYAGKAFFVIGGASNVGQYAIQFAKWAGFSPIIATASLHNTELIKSYGATHVIDRTLSTEKIIQEIKATTGGTVDIVYDAVTSEETVALGIEALREGGTLLVVLYHLDEFIKERSAPKKLLNVTARGIMTLPGNVGVLADLYAKLPETLERGIIRPVPYEVLPDGLVGIPGGLVRLEKDQVSAAKLVARPHETK